MNKETVDNCKKKLDKYQKFCEQLDLTIAQQMIELLKIYNLQWDIGLKVESANSVEPQQLETYQTLKTKATTLKTFIEELKRDKENLLEKISDYERFLSIIEDRQN